MSPPVTVREFAWLTTDDIESDLDQAQIPHSAFKWLCDLNDSFTKGGTALAQIAGRCWLKLDNFVGVLESPCGTQLEILPKHFEQDDCIEQSRRLLCKMIQTAFNLKTRRVGPADLMLFDAPLSEWVMQQFLLELDHLFKRGVRFDYQRVEEEQRYLRGQLDIVRQMRQPPGRQHQFQLRHDIFLPDRPENRLLMLALQKVCKSTQQPDSWRLAHELRGLLHELPASRDVKADLKLWRDDRLMAHYQHVKPWCELVLGENMPIAVSGGWHGISLLFPMERLFERYVEACLRTTLPASATLQRQVKQEFLCWHNEEGMFQLKPDMLIALKDRRWVLDTKWKRLDHSTSKYGLSQSDFYQLLAYGQRYLKDQQQGEMLLIYPCKASFNQPLPEFRFSSDLRLWVVPFDLELGVLVDRQPIPLPLWWEGLSESFAAEASVSG
ncbi:MULTISPECIES: McrC family protein [unclassified Pseudomonas]|uniref:McrC family protein n=1 Tax=unclassified Pseudomonas TaxID=196821 RepID=UPI001F599649|nr:MULTISPECIES: McrC family protein [unclassified Pseudomonas]UNM17223.1 McrC family protein [Pseudomonas sp. ArH3a]UXZ20092.1 McrC family protein [Pseudomonas sp. YeP6b]